jgi:hypothetical protein
MSIQDPFFSSLFKPWQFHANPGDDVALNLTGAGSYITAYALLITVYHSTGKGCPFGLFHLPVETENFRCKIDQFLVQLTAVDL